MLQEEIKPKGWYSRGYLPHFDGVETTQSVIFRLAGSIPAKLLNFWREELQHLKEMDADLEIRKRIEHHLDQGSGNVFLKDPAIAEFCQSALLHFDGSRYRLHAWVVMPNHVHVLFTPSADFRLGSIVHSWKSFTANQANRLLGRSGAFWDTEYHDRYIRDETHFNSSRHYIDMNPVKAGLCEKPEDWSWSSASHLGPQASSLPNP